VGRVKNGSIIYQITERLKSLQCFGQSKHQAKKEYRDQKKDNGEKWNPAFAEGIYSYKTFDAYKQTAMVMAKWIKTEHPEIKRIDGINKNIAIQYLQMRQNEGKSAYTVSKDMSAINKVYGMSICKKEAGLNERSYKNITRSRVDRPNDKKYNPKNYTAQIIFAKATGSRRESVLGGQYQVKPCSVWQDAKGNIFVGLVEKGGKFRNAPVLGGYRAQITEIIPYIPVRVPCGTIREEEAKFKELYKNSKEGYLFSKYTKKIDNHAFRAEYARARYQELIEQKNERGEEILRGYRGYDQDCLGQVSKDLGHNRISVVAEHYMR